MKTEPKKKTVRVTLDIELTSLPRDEWDDFDIEDDDSISSDWPLEELSSDEVAACVEGGLVDNPELFAGSMLYLKVVGVTVADHKVLEPESA